MYLRRYVACVVVLAVTWFAANPAEAQGPGGRQFGGGFGGGGFGARSVVSLAAIEAVQKDLEISADDVEKLKKLADVYRQDARSEFEKAGTGGGGFQNLTEEERTKLLEKFAEIRKSLDAKFVPQLKEILTADQFTRLQQIQLQSQGNQALSSPEVVKALALTKEQQDQLKAVNEETGTKFRELFTGGGGFNEETRTKMQELGKERDAKLMAVLTDAQKEKFTSMKGKEFDVTQLQRGPGGPPRQRPQQ